MAKIVKSKAVIFFTLIFVAVTAFFCIKSISDVKQVKSEFIGSAIVLDAGHGGVDGGCVGVNTGIKEKDLNLSVVLKLESYLKSANYNVILTRKNDEGLYGNEKNNRKKADMLKRKQIIEEADPIIVVSVHMNKYPGQSRRGAQTFYKKGDGESQKLASYVQNRFNLMETSKRDYSALTGDYYITNVSPCPSIIAECGFLSNPDDEALLITEEYRDKIAYALYRGIIDYLTEPVAG